MFVYAAVMHKKLDKKKKKIECKIFLYSVHIIVFQETITVTKFSHDFWKGVRKSVYPA